MGIVTLISSKSKTMPYYIVYLTICLMVRRSSPWQMGRKCLLSNLRAS